MGLFDIGSKDLVLILVIIVFLWGGNKIPQLMRSVGEGLREFRRGAADIHDEIAKAASPDDTSAKHSDLS